MGPHMKRRGEQHNDANKPQNSSWADVVEHSPEQRMENDETHSRARPLRAQPVRAEAADGLQRVAGHDFGGKASQSVLTNFPSPQESKKMKGAQTTPRQSSTGVSDLLTGKDNQRESTGRNQETEGQTSFADIANKNLDTAPPSAAVPPVPAQPSYDEDTLMKEAAKRETRKYEERSHDTYITPEMAKARERQKRKEAKRATAPSLDPVGYSLSRFDRDQRGKFTVFDSLRALRGMGYSWFSAIPIVLLLHICLSPLTSPVGDNFSYRSATDLLTLTVYVGRAMHSLNEKTLWPFNANSIDYELRQYGQTRKGVRGFGFLGGLRALGKRVNLKWYQLGTWIRHFFWWFVAFTMMQDSKSNLVTSQTLFDLCNAPSTQG